MFELRREKIYGSREKIQNEEMLWLIAILIESTSEWVDMKHA
jgi:hypothetical protein